MGTKIFDLCQIKEVHKNINLLKSNEDGVRSNG
jgi:hypothetical protein